MSAVDDAAAPAGPGDLAGAVQHGVAAFRSARDLDELAAAHTTHLGTRSAVVAARRGIGALPGGERAQAGRRVNEALTELEQAYAARRRDLEVQRDERMLVAESVDVTLPTERGLQGGRHPLSLIDERIADIFVAMGYEVAEGPEVEAEWLNFDALNMGPDHPARQEHDTLYIAPAHSGVLLRTHTSPVQLRALLERPLPVYVVCPGRTYRDDPMDATHSPVFNQVEGLAVDEGITMADLRGTLEHLAELMFGPGTDMRWRPSFFPFTEPSAEPDIRCFVCHGRSAEPGGSPCRVCGSEGWIEWGGCGMVHPHVLVAAGIDPDRYSGFAFGMGLERTLMFRHDIPDIRYLVEGDVRFSRALGTGE